MYASYTSVSTQILMRVLPGCGMTSPRLAWLKSYSSNMSSSWFVGIVSPFRPAGFSGRNQLDGIVALIGIDDHQQFAGQRERIAEDLTGLLEAHPMPPQILH